MTDNTQPEAMRLANVCSNLTRYSMDAHLIAAELRRQHARIAELEAIGAGGVSGPLMGIAAPPTAQAGGWISVQDELPKCSKKPDSFGVEVLIWPPHEDGSRTAFYGRRQSREPNFYKYGALLGHVEFWRYPPPPPTSAEGVEHG